MKRMMWILYTIIPGPGGRHLDPCQHAETAKSGNARGTAPHCRRGSEGRRFAGNEWGG